MANCRILKIRILQKGKTTNQNKNKIPKGNSILGEKVTKDFYSLLKKRSINIKEKTHFKTTENKMSSVYFINILK